MYRHKTLIFCIPIVGMFSLTKANKLNNESIEYSNYKLEYSLVKKEIQASKEIKVLKEIEYGILKEGITKTNTENGWCIDYRYYPIKNSLINSSSQPKSNYFNEFKISINNQFKPLKSLSDPKAIGFYLNNFRYGFSFSPDFLELGSTWTATVLDNQYTYCSDFQPITDYSSLKNFSVEYKVTEIKKTNDYINTYTIEWNGIRNYVGYIINSYSRRHGQLVIDSDGTLRQLTIYTPKMIKGFDESLPITDTTQETCLSFTKIKSKIAKKYLK